MDLETALKAAVLGVIEGLTEFIPVSSTGHLLVANQLLGFEDPGEVFTVVIQLGAILAVCAYYARRLTGVALRLPSDPQARRFVAQLAAASLPAAVIGLAFNDWLEANLFVRDVIPRVIAVTLTLGGAAIIFIERRRREPHHSDPWNLPWTTAIAVGFCQLMALMPGVSRSGATILGAVLLGVHRRAAAEFSFFLAIPVMFGASFFKLAKHRDLLDDRLGAIAIGFAVAFVSALAVVHWLLRYVASHDFSAFGWYRIAAGLVLAGLLLGGLL